MRYVFDGQKNFYSINTLKLGGKRELTSVQLMIDGRPADFKIKLKMVDRVGLYEVLDYCSNKKHDQSERVII